RPGRPEDGLLPREARSTIREPRRGPLARYGLACALGLAPDVHALPLRRPSGPPLPRRPRRPPASRRGDRLPRAVRGRVRFAGRAQQSGPRPPTRRATLRARARRPDDRGGPGRRRDRPFQTPYGPKLAAA